MIAFRVQNRLVHAQIGFLWGFNSKFPTSIPAPFIWESPPYPTPGRKLQLFNCLTIKRRTTA